MAAWPRPACGRTFVCVQVPLVLIYFNGIQDFPAWKYTPEPPGLAARVQQVPKRRLSSEEREVFKRDGVVIVRGVMPDERILGFFDSFPEMDWRRTHSGAMHALLRDGPLGGLAASALGVAEARVFEVSVWQQPSPLPFGLGSVHNWHQDYHEDEEGKMIPIVSTWLSLSEDARALEFALGSHKRSVKTQCSSPHAWQIWMLPDDCVREAYPSATKAFVFDKGDVAVFQGQVLHQGLNAGEHRLAIAVRWVAAGAQYSRRLYQSNSLVEYGRYMPQDCGPFDSPLFPVFPRAKPSPNETGAGLVGQDERWPVIPTFQDVFAMWKPISDYNSGQHRSLPPCNATWDDGTDL